IDAVNMATGVDASIGSAISRTELCKVIEARVFQIIDQVAAEIDAEGLLGRLPSGMVLTGGGSLLPYLPEFIQENLKVPAKVARPSQSLGLPKQIEFPQMSAAAGLIKTCLMDHRAAGDASSQKNQRRMGRGVKDLLKGLIDLN
ncbi:MAG: rod shape-determining protein, partial [Firmicutes bacterium]|nr:rod shape-determining protein [Bacillota bacterium]